MKICFCRMKLISLSGLMFILLSGCAHTVTHENNPAAAPDTEIESIVTSEDTRQNHIQAPEESGQPETTLFLSEYTGYLDEYTGWTLLANYQNQDYDGDGLEDRIYREYVTGGKISPLCNFRVEFGDGSTLTVSGQDGGCVPFFTSITPAFGKQFIAYQTFYPGACGEVINAELAMFEKYEKEYRLMDLPFTKSMYNEDTFTQYVHVNVRVTDAHNCTLTYKCEEFPEFVEEVAMTEEEYQWGSCEWLYGPESSFSKSYEECQVYTIKESPGDENTYICTAHVIYHCADEIAFAIKYDGTEWQVMDVFMKKRFE